MEYIRIQSSLFCWTDLLCFLKSDTRHKEAPGLSCLKNRSLSSSRQQCSSFVFFGSMLFKLDPTVFFDSVTTGGLKRGFCSAYRILPRAVLSPGSLQTSTTDAAAARQDGGVLQDVKTRRKRRALQVKDLSVSFSGSLTIASSLSQNNC